MVSKKVLACISFVVGVLLGQIDYTPCVQYMTLLANRFFLPNESKQKDVIRRAKDDNIELEITSIYDESNQLKKIIIENTPADSDLSLKSLSYYTKGLQRGDKPHWDGSTFKYVLYDATITQQAHHFCIEKERGKIKISGFDKIYELMTENSKQYSYQLILKWDIGQEHIHQPTYIELRYLN